MMNNQTINLTLNDWGTIENIPVTVDEDNRIQGEFVVRLFDLDFTITFTIEDDILYSDMCRGTDINDLPLNYKPISKNYRLNLNEFSYTML